MLQKNDNTDIIESMVSHSYLKNTSENYIISLTYNKMQNFLKFLLHSVVGTIILGGISFLISIHPNWFDATIGSLIVNLYTFLVATQGNTSVSYHKSV